MHIKNVTLEMSLKPFKQTDDAYITSIIEKLFDQWYALTKHADMASVLLWTADGSEILDYRGSMDDELEWARYVGGATRKMALNPNDPDHIGLHSRPYLYMDNPPVITYGMLRHIVHKLKEIGTRRLGKPVRVGATFDPGPEFAKSSFKYERHPEICCGDTMGASSFVCAHTVLNGDTVAYAGYPDGIPDKTPFGVFFGRQSQHFLTDLGFDYIWFSNGFGFGTETWGMRGTIFDGEQFHIEKVDAVQKDILAFWQYFRQECPTFRIETRGTNLATGCDLASDAVSLKQIYEGGFNMLPPPNSPWAAINGDFGIELAGHMSRICELPDEDYPFRYYPHDPWWMNSPWLDRYGREAHDIYLPLALTRLDGSGKTHPPNNIQFLTVDNSLGGIPDQVPNEVIPHILAALAVSPDAPSPLVWVYPFDEYHEWARSERINEVFFGDWFMRGAIAQGFPLNTVVSTGNFLSIMQQKADFFAGSVLVSPIPNAGSEVESRLLEIIQAGGQVLLYGSLLHAGAALLDALHLRHAEPIFGQLQISLANHIDTLHQGSFPQQIIHRSIMNAGGIGEVLQSDENPSLTVCATVSDGVQTRVAALTQQNAHGGLLGWVRGTISSGIEPDQRLPAADDLKTTFSGESLMRILLAQFGYAIQLHKFSADARTPLTLVHRHVNAFYFSGFTPDTTVQIKLCFPQGAPLLLGFETYIEDGFSTYHMPRAWHRECRVFVNQQKATVVSCVEIPAVSYWGKRKIAVRGLENATVRFYPESGFEQTTKVLLNAKDPYVIGEPVESALRHDSSGRYIEVINASGTLIFAWDLPQKSSAEVHQLTAIYQ